MSGKPKISHAVGVAAVFDQLAQVAPASNWTAELRQRALKRRVGWKAEVESYVQGLVAAGQMTPPAEAQYRENLKQCESDSGWGREIFLTAACVVAVAVVSIMATELASTRASTVIMIGFLALAGGVWAGTRPWLYRHNNPSLTWERKFMILVSAAVAPYCTFLIAAAVVVVMQHFSVKHFLADRAAFEADPHGFPVIKKMAREQYGMHVVLAGSDRAWAYTSLSLPGASPAYMTVLPGYCQLSISPETVLRAFDAVGHVDKVQWLQGVTMHEFAHCLDFSRDTAMAAKGDIGTHSLAPIDAKNIRNIEDYLDATDSEKTELWREAIADIFAVGYWKLSTPANAGDLVASLRKKRSDAVADTTHATMCWIDYAQKASLPASMANLFAWADSLRSSAACQLPNPRSLTPLQRWAKHWL